MNRHQSEKLKVVGIYILFAAIALVVYLVMSVA